MLIFFSIQLLIREILFSRNLSFRAESSEIKILPKFSEKFFFIREIVKVSSREIIFSRSFSILRQLKQI